MSISIETAVRRTGCRLSYVRVGTTDVRRTGTIAAEVLGLEPVLGDEGQVLFRSDGRHHTLALVAPEEEAIGIECADLADSAARLHAAGFAARKATEEECRLRHVRAALFTADASGNTIELVTRPAHSGKRFFPPFDARITGLRAAALRSIDIEGDTRFWIEALGAEIADWVGDITYFRIDGGHHQIALYPASRPGILYHVYGVADLDAIMRSFYTLSDRQIEIAHGPGRETASGDIFLRARVPGGAVFSFVVPGEELVPGHAPRQFERTADSLCSWGSRSETLPELAEATFP